jgi:hypothetical protein
MKSKIILTSILSIIVFAGILNAQHVKAFDGAAHSLFVPAVSPDSSRSGGTWQLFARKVETSAIAFHAGQTVRLRIASTNNRGLLIFEGVLPATYQVGCDGDQPASLAASGFSVGKTSWSFNNQTNEYNYLWKTDKAWKGTCQMLNIRLKDGTNHRAKIRFR